MKFPPIPPDVDLRRRETRRIITALLMRDPRSFFLRAPERNSDLCSPGGARTFLIASVDARLRQHLRNDVSRFPGRSDRC